MAAKMKGLTMFISEIRNCTTKDQEQERVDKEMAHIRVQFASKGLDGYGKKKYVWKLVYLYMLGYDIDIGHMEAQQLITSTKYSEKSAGYVALSVLLNETHVLLRLIIQSIKKDLASENEVHKCLALCTVANVGGQEFAESLTADVIGLLLGSTAKPFVRKKAALCLLRLFRKYPDVIPVGGDWPTRLLALMDGEDIGVLTSVMSLVLGVVSNKSEGYEDAPVKAVNILAKMSSSKERKSIYRYYLTLCPWLQVKLLRTLQYFPPPSDRNIHNRLHNVLSDILTKTAVTKNINKNNADHAILFEAINVIIHLAVHGVTDLLGQANGLLGRFIQIKEPNFRYLGLETMARLAKSVPQSAEEKEASIKRHQAVIQQLLKDPDVSIRKRALDLLYHMCDASNAQEIVATLLKYLVGASYEMREDLVLKIAILAERHNGDMAWYVDVVLQLISLAGDFVSEDIWFRVVQVVTNNEAVQDHAATTCFKFLSGPAVHENGVKVGAYIIAEFGHKIKNTRVTGESLLDVLVEKFKTASLPTKALLLTAFMKMANTYPDLKPRVDALFAAHRDAGDVEIQQRANEYYLMLNSSNDKLVIKVFEVMPDFPEKKEGDSILERKADRRTRGTADKNRWATGGGERKTEKKEEAESSEDEEEKGEGEEGDDVGETEEGAPSPAVGAVAARPAASVEGRVAVAAIAVPVGAGAGAPGGPPVTARPAPAPTAGIIDLASIMGPPTPTAASGAGSSSSSTGGFSIDAPSVAEVPFPPQAPTAVPALLKKDPVWGVLYESKTLQIGYKAQIDGGHQCKMVLYHGNRSSEPITGVTATLPEHPAFKVQVRPLASEAFDVAAGAQVLHYFLWVCHKPFSDAPAITLSFTHAGAAHTIVLRVPIVLNSFVTPVPSDAATFIPAWTSIGNEVIAMRRLPAVAVVDELKALCVSSFHMALIDGVEKTPQNFVASGLFNTATKDPSGNFVTMPAYIRVETRPGEARLRISVHSGHASVSNAIVYSVTQILGAAE